jgi:ATP-dependent protease ClpP protease subunit
MGMSAGSYLFMMGDERIVHRGAILMWHTVHAQHNGVKPYTIPEGKWKVMGMLDRYIIREFKNATGLSDKWVHYWLESKTANFMSAETAYNVGIATHFVD